MFRSACASQRVLHLSFFIFNTGDTRVLTRSLHKVDSITIENPLHGIKCSIDSETQITEVFSFLQGKENTWKKNLRENKNISHGRATVSLRQTKRTDAQWCAAVQ